MIDTKKTIMWEKLIQKMQIIISATYIKLFQIMKRKQLKNNDFSIICSNCVGGVISHRLGVRFNSPTVNLWIRQRDFIKLCLNLKEYMGYDLEFISTKYSYPVAKLKDIYIYFNHYESERAAAIAWNRRRDRINYDNLYLIMYDIENLTIEELRQIEHIPCKGKAVFSERRFPELEYVVNMKSTGSPMGSQCMDKNWLGKYTFERYFNYVKWLNSND